MAGGALGLGPLQRIAPSELGWHHPSALPEDAGMLLGSVSCCRARTAVGCSPWRRGMLGGGMQWDPQGIVVTKRSEAVVNRTRRRRRTLLPTPRLRNDINKSAEALLLFFGARFLSRRGIDPYRQAASRGREDGLVAPAELLPALLGPRGRTVTGSSRDESSGPRLTPLLLRKMINKSRGKILGVLALFLVMVWYSIYREDSFYFPIQENKTTCPLGEVQQKAAQLIANYTRDHPLFLQLKDYFWVKTPSLYELPYGTKGSEEVLLRLLSITHYSLPESIRSLKCRRCAVVGNGHRLRNSSMGETIDTYDVVIRLNNAPVHGYEQDVGSKTTMRLFYPESAHFDPRAENNPDTLLVLVPFKPVDFQWMEAILNDKKRVRKGFWKQPPLIWDANPEHVRILNPYYMEVTAAKLLNLSMKQPRKVKQKPTTGLLAITLALHFCDLVHIAGFGYPDSADKKQTIHYYEQITLKSMAVSEHNVSHEAVAIKRMLELGLVRNLTYF